MLNPIILPFYGTGNSLTNPTKHDDRDDSLAYAPVTYSGLTSQETVLVQTHDDVDRQNSIGKWVDADKRKKTECEPYPQNLYFRKFYSGKDKNLPKELKELFTPLKCNLCHCSMGSTVTAKDHYEGKKHISNVKKWLVDHPEYGDKFCLTDTNQQKVIDPDRLYCKYCNVMMSSEQQAHSHFIGKKHQSVINNGVMKNGYFNLSMGQWETSSTKEMDRRFGFGMGFIFNSKEKDVSQKFFCETCQVTCPSLITYNDHLAGAKHKKKLTILLDSEPILATKDNILEDVIKNGKKQTSPADLSIYRTPSGKYYCHSCNVTVNSPIQFLQHSESRKHKHKSSSSAGKLCK